MWERKPNWMFTACWRSKAVRQSARYIESRLKMTGRTREGFFDRTGPFTSTEANPGLNSI
jgi:hypothetical protein